jgi:hypothetical protein
MTPSPFTIALTIRLISLTRPKKPIQRKHIAAHHSLTPFQIEAQLLHLQESKWITLHHGGYKLTSWATARIAAHYKRKPE